MRALRGGGPAQSGVSRMNALRFFHHVLAWIDLALAFLLFLPLWVIGTLARG